MNDAMNDAMDDAMDDTTGDTVDVVVVGAGLAGLTAARDLVGHGLRVAVLESADRVGGRSYAETSTLGSRLDLGGQWVGHGHHRVAALAQELGLTAFPMHTGLMPRIVDGRRRLHPWSPAVVVAALALVVLDVIRRIRPGSRSNTVTVDRWLRRVPGRTARRLLEVTALISWTADPDRVSLRAGVRLIRAQHGLLTMLTTKGGAQEGLLVEGAGSLAERLADGVPVRTGQRVVSVHRDDTGVTVRTRDTALRAARAVITVAPPVAARIAHEPPLPADRQALQRDTFMGTVYKAVAVYDRPFWRSGITGELMSLGSPGFVAFDTSPPDGPGHLCVLIAGRDARELDALDPDARRRTVLEPIARHLGAAVLEPADWHEKAWHRDEHVGGGYMAIPEPGTTTALWPMPATPVGRVHWAGTETAHDHPGYLDGAIESGERVAAEVVAALAADPRRTARG